MSTNYTPGPWFVEPERESDGDYLISIPRNDKTIFTTKWVARSVIADKTECKANATLIAAAPELLEALKELVSKTDPTQYPVAIGYIMARKAIAKAEGRE